MYMREAYWDYNVAYSVLVSQEEIKAVDETGKSSTAFTCQSLFLRLSLGLPRPNDFQSYGNADRVRSSYVTRSSKTNIL